MLELEQCKICYQKSRLILKEEYQKYSLWECPLCQGQFWFPMKNPGAEWYQEDERYSFRNRNPVKKPELNHREFLKDNPADKGKLLDIGMGTGHFLKAASNKGYQVFGIDFDKDAVKTAKEVFGLENVYVLDLKEVVRKFGKHFFNVITFFEVLEHLENPSGFIKQAKSLLKREGYLALSLPYRGSWDVFKKLDKPPRHLTRWNVKAMKNLLEQNGFRIIRTKIIPLPFSYLVAKFHFWFKGILSFGLVEKAAPNVSKFKISSLKAAAKFKDRVLFSIPAAFLYAYLWLRGRLGLSLYVLAVAI